MSGIDAGRFHFVHIQTGISVRGFQIGSYHVDHDRLHGANVSERIIIYLRLYPDPVVTDLVDGIAQFYQVDPSQVFVGVGSDDVLAMLFMTFFNSKKPILFPDITYSFYDVWAEMLRIPYTQIPLDDAFRLNPSDYKCENGGIVFPNPNAPTGELLPVSAIEEIIQANPDVIVIVDEAYIDFGGESALPLIDKYDNVIVVQTFSKSRSLAGSRIGFAISNPTLIKYLNDVKYSFNSYTMDRITIALGTASIRDRHCHHIGFFTLTAIRVFYGSGAFFIIHKALCKPLVIRSFQPDLIGAEIQRIEHGFDQIAVCKLAF